jgi:hypothetical protein
MGVYFQPVRGRRLNQPFAIARVIVIREKDGLPVVAALDHMQRLTLDEPASQAGHCGTFPAVPSG